MIYIQGENTLIPLTLDLSNYYTKEEIEEAIANIDLSQYALVSEVEANKIITDAHIDNDDIHITSEEREKWNSGISSSGVSQEYVDTVIANLVDSAPDTLNTLNELAIAIQENDSIIGTLDAAITNKADKNDLVQSNWNENDENSLNYIQNRTHYIYTGENIILEEDILYSHNYDFDNYAGEIATNIGACIGETFTVIFNNIKYTNLIAYQEGYGTNIGDSNLINTPFYIRLTSTQFIVTSEIPNNTSITILEEKEFFKPLDEAYIPDTIARVDKIPSIEGLATEEYVDTAIASEANQNAFSFISAGSSIAEATNPTDGIELTGDGYVNIQYDKYSVGSNYNKVITFNLNMDAIYNEIIARLPNAEEASF